MYQFGLDVFGVVNSPVEIVPGLIISRCMFGYGPSGTFMFVTPDDLTGLCKGS